MASTRKPYGATIWLHDKLNGPRERALFCPHMSRDNFGLATNRDLESRRIGSSVPTMSGTRTSCILRVF